MNRIKRYYDDFYLMATFEKDGKVFAYNTKYRFKERELAAFSAYIISCTVL